MATRSPQKPILISGAGLASLLLAQAFLRASIPFVIFERDSSFTQRAQGYRLALSSKGLDSVESVLGPEAWQRFWDTCGKTGGAGFVNIDGPTGEKIDDLKPAKVVGGGEQPTVGGEAGKAVREALTSRNGKIVGISRGEMRRLFMDGCEPFVRWSHTVAGYELTPDGVHAVFADGSKSEEGSLLVGGEGIYSRVAKRVSGGALKVYDTGARGVHGQAPAAAYKGLGEGVWRLVDDSGSARLLAITNVRAGVDLDDPAAPTLGWTISAQPGVIRAPGDDYSLVGPVAAAIAKDLTKHWHPRLRPLFDQMIEADAAFWKITCSTPTGVPEWVNQPRVTLVGDAAHSMTPAGGLGANTSLRDAALLGRLLAEAGGYVEGVTAAYEKEMRIYASEAVRTSYALGAAQFGFSIDENTPTV